MPGSLELANGPSQRTLVDRAALVPIFGGRSLVLVSERVGNYQFHPLHGTLLDQLWVK